jgi:threonylcarbamoyladenosine tRNA methylthiotransferase MtaB
MINKSKSISFFTLGCRLNQSETAVLENAFRLADYTIVDNQTPADYSVINTCTVTAAGDADTRRLVNKIVRRNPRTRIALIGCLSQIQKERLISYPNVFWIVGNEKKMDLVAIVNATKDTDNPQVITPAISQENFSLNISGSDRRHTRANLKIQDGCDAFCSFCEIPYARGRSRSRKFANIISEAHNLIARGHQEIVLTGINIGSYFDDDKHLEDVIAELNSLNDLKRIRISSIELTTLTDRFLKYMFPNGKLCRHWHVPLQSGHDDILKAMNRKYTVKEFQAHLNHALLIAPELNIGTDVIVGFPGESDHHFEATFDFLQNNPVQYFHVFSYSKRRFAKSIDLSNSVPNEIIQIRSQRLRDLSRRKRRLYHERFLGKSVGVLFEQQKNNWWFGVTDHFVRVRVHSNLQINNRLLPVMLTGLYDEGLQGELI